MSIESDRKSYVPLLFLFLLLTGLFGALWFLLPGNKVNFRVLLIGNLLLFVVGFISAQISARALQHKNPQVFLRLVYTSFLMKFFILGLGAFIYIALYKNEINKPALFGCFGIYFIYSFIEVRSVMKLSKKTNA